MGQVSPLYSASAVPLCGESKSLALVIGTFGNLLACPTVSFRGVSWKPTLKLRVECVHARIAVH
jgi:hypothetical protein